MAHCTQCNENEMSEENRLEIIQIYCFIKSCWWCLVLLGVALPFAESWARTRCPSSWPALLTCLLVRESMRTICVIHILCVIPKKRTNISAARIGYQLIALCPVSGVLSERWLHIMLAQSDCQACWHSFNILFSWTPLWHRQRNIHADFVSGVLDWS